MILFLILLTQFILCWSAKPLDYTPLLKYLDDDIARELMEPLEGRGAHLIDFVKTYNSRLVDVKDMIDQNVYEAYVKAIELQKIGGPQFLKVKMDREQLKTLFKWTDDDFSKLEEQFGETKKLWKELEDGFASAGAVFKRIHEEEAKEKAEQAEREAKRVKELRKAEEDFNKRVTVNIGTAKPTA